DQSGQDRYTTEVVLRPYKGEMTFLDGREGGGASMGGGDFGGGRIGGGPGDAMAGGGGGGGGGGRSGGFGSDLDDEIPF
ncbi:MAG: single-stranded DNA-binding protein, partial [Pseudomonadota bacterium]